MIRSNPPLVKFSEAEKQPIARDRFSHTNHVVGGVSRELNERAASASAALASE